MRSDGRALPDLAQTLVLRQLGLIRTDQLPDLAARVNPGRLRRVTLAALSPRLLAPALAVHGRSRQARRAEGAPLKNPVEIVVTSPTRSSTAGFRASFRVQGDGLHWR